MMTMLPMLKALLGRNVLLISAIIGLLTTGLLWDRNRIATARNDGAQAVKKAIDTKGAKDVQKSAHARAAAGATPANCLRDPHCRRD